MLVTPTTLYHIPLPHRLSIHQEILQSHLLCHIIYVVVVVVVVNLLLRVVIVGGSDGGFEDGLFLDLIDNLVSSCSEVSTGGSFRELVKQGSRDSSRDQPA